MIAATAGLANWWTLATILDSWLAIIGRLKMTQSLCELRDSPTLRCQLPMHWRRSVNQVVRRARAGGFELIEIFGMVWNSFFNLVRLELHLGRQARCSMWRVKCVRSVALQTLSTLNELVTKLFQSLMPSKITTIHGNIVRYIINVRWYVTLPLRLKMVEIIIEKKITRKSRKTQTYHSAITYNARSMQSHSLQ